VRTAAKKHRAVFHHPGRNVWRQEKRGDAPDDLDHREAHMTREEIYLSETAQVWQAALAQDLFPGDLVIEIARFFLGTPYQAGTLEAPGPEKLTVTLTQFDCMTFVETVLALARCAAAGKLSVAQFRKNLTLIRYRGGKIAGYASRLHYFSDWIRDNEKKSVLRNVTAGLGGRPRRKKINFMTTHRTLYAGLKTESQFTRLKKIEKSLSRRFWRVVEAKNLARLQGGLRPGDVFALTTEQEGLDVAHIGFVVKEGRSLRLLHASRREGAVVVSGKTLAAFVKGNRKFSGVMVARFCR
jgi:hypothetical protein